MAYIAECFNAGRGSTEKDGRTLGVAALLYKPEEQTYKQSNFSRFVFSINQNKTSIKANLKLDERALMMERYRASVKMLLDYEMRKVSGATPAFTVPLTGVYKGKTVAEVLTGANPELEVDKLNKTKKWLQDNLATYPANQKMIDAIEDGIDLYKAGRLNMNAVAPAFPLIDGDKKYFTTEKDGKRLCYSLNIQFNAIWKQPYRISIMNFWCPIVERTIEYSKATDIVERNINLSQKEMASLMSQMQFAMDCFIALHGADICKEATIE